MWARWLLVALGVLLGAVIMVRGDVLIGGIILVMAVVRGSIFLQWEKRRRDLRTRYPRHRDQP